MLHYMGTRQPPRKYVVAEGADTTTISHNRSCSICRSRVWTPESFRVINNAPVEQERVSVYYQITSEELRKSVLGGCEFCKTLADGIHGKVFLDELYERLRESESCSETNASEDVESGSENANKEPEDIEQEWTDASAFNEEEFGNDVTGGWDAWKERDTLIEACQFEVEISFERGHAGHFTFVNAYIEAVDKTDHPTSLQKLQGEKSLELRYNVNSKDNRLSTSSIFPPWTADSMLGAETNMKMLGDWMHSLQPIAQSATTTTLNYLPSRLIQLCDKGGLRIIQTSTIEDHEPKFSALSYVWGTNQTFILLSTTEDMLTTGFGTEQLPKTIQDAVTVTRRIGIEYIWVDALCIMQDSDKDKAQELPKMRSIYKYATVTVVASVAKSATEGFLHHVEEKYDYFIEPVTIPFPANMAQPTCSEMVLSYPADYKRWKDPINNRAWTFQELILSTRAILFSYRGVQTIDRTSPGSADGMTSGKDPQLPSLPWSGKLFSLATTPENTRQVWLAIRGEYSRRMLSYQGDKLVAISAIAEELGQTYNSRYLAGMWERDLAIDLQWNCPRNETVDGDNHNRKPRAQGYVAPSWSWASVSGAVEDFVQVWEDEGNDGGIGYKSRFGFEVISCEVELAVPGFEYGAVTSGILVARGRICTLSWHPHAHDEQHRLLESDGYLAGLADSGESGLANTGASARCGEGTLDAVDPDMHGGVEVVCLGGRLVENVPGREDVEGMMLLATTEGQYRRVGFFRVQTGAFEKGERAVVTIV